MCPPGVVVSIASVMLFTFMAAARFSEEIGCFGVLTHPLDGEVQAFYGRFGRFETLPFERRGSMIVRIADLEAKQILMVHHGASFRGFFQQ